MTDTEQQSDADRRWFLVVALWGLTFAVWMGNFTQAPGIITGMIALGTGTVFLGSALVELPSQFGMLNERVCAFLGHDWDVGPPPWSGKEYHHNPKCESCGHTPDEIAIAGQYEGDHRV